MVTTPREAVDLLEKVSERAVARLNRVTQEDFQTRGGRAGSGLGSLLEALWGFMVNIEVKLCPGGHSLDVAWFPDHAYNDFACVLADSPWDPETKAGELFRIEAKSMYKSADESKGHFDALQSELGEHDLLVILIWDWVPVTTANTHLRVYPKVLDSFVGSAIEIARFRDALHEARGGSFVVEPCPDKCQPGCPHIGEPLNADQRRERRTGPQTLKPKSASYAANFGGLVRMLKTNSNDARVVFRRLRAESDTVHRFVSFIHEAFPDEESNQYLAEDWKKCARTIGISSINTMSREAIIAAVRAHPSYRDVIRDCLMGYP